jgi:hypothetical protein
MPANNLLQQIKNAQFPIGIHSNDRRKELKEYNGEVATA